MKKRNDVKARLVSEILGAMSYRSSEDSCNSVYVGGLATARVVGMLHGRYGEDEIEDLLKDAALGDIEKVHEYLTPYTKYMKKHPTRKCPTCGQIMPVRR